MNTRTPETEKGRERVGQCVWDRSTNGQSQSLGAQNQHETNGQAASATAKSMGLGRSGNSWGGRLATLAIPPIGDPRSQQEDKRGVVKNSIKVRVIDDKEFWTFRNLRPESRDQDLGCDVRSWTCACESLEGRAMKKPGSRKDRGEG